MNELNDKTFSVIYRGVLTLAGTLAAIALGLVVLTGNGRSPLASDSTYSTGSAKPGIVKLAAAAQQMHETQPASSSTGGQQIASATPSTDRAAIENIIRDYLMQNPEILLEMQQVLEIKMNAEREKKARTAMIENADKIFRSPADPVIGNKDGDVTVVEFFDYNCGFCRRAITHIRELVENDKNVKVVMKEFPIFGEESEQASLAALAAGKQGKYWEMHRALLEQPGRANKDKALKIARELKLDMEKLQADMKRPEIRQVITDAQKIASTMGIQGTPHFLVGPKTIPGAPEDLLTQIESRVTEVRKTGCTVC